MNHRGRGRPKSDRPEKDFGTPELQQKRKFHLTEEVLDSYLRRSIISPNQHWCGIHFRWLHTLRYGIPNVKAVDTTHLGGRECGVDNEEWKLQREEELASAIKRLRHEQCYEIILNMCVFNVDIITCKDSWECNQKWHQTSEKYFKKFVNGMDILESLWFSAPHERGRLGSG